MTRPQSKTGMRCLALGLLLAGASVVTAADTRLANASPSARPLKYYQQPTGFGGHQWDEPLMAFKNLPIATPWHVEASKGTEEPSFDSFHPCTQQALTSGPSCDVTSYVSKLDMPGHKPDMHLVMQYRVDAQGFRVSDALVLHPVTHFFCTQWRGEGSMGAPPKIAERMKYCGVRLDFTSETTAELAVLPAEHVSRYEQLLKYVLRHYGPPYNYRGRVIVSEGEQAARGQSGMRDFPDRYRWCTDLDSIMAPKCTVKMVLTFDAATGIGSLLMATMPLQSFAQVQKIDSHDHHGALYYELLTNKTGEHAVGD